MLIGLRVEIKTDEWKMSRFEISQLLHDLFELFHSCAILPDPFTAKAPRLENFRMALNLSTKLRCPPHASQARRGIITSIKFLLKFKRKEERKRFRLNALCLCPSRDEARSSRFRENIIPQANITAPYLYRSIRISPYNHNV